jgi:hypothetical protein
MPRAGIPPLIVCVCGGPRTGSNLVAAIVNRLGFPCRVGAWDERDEMMPTGSFDDGEFATLRVLRSPPWVFKCHGFKDPRHEEYFLSLPVLTDSFRVIETTRGADVILESMRRCAELHDAGELVYGRVQRNKSIEFVTGLWASRKKRFLDRYLGPLLTVDFDLLVGDPNGVVKEIAEFLGVQFLAEASRLVDSGLRHFRQMKGG